MDLRYRIMLRINNDKTPKQVTKDPKRHETGRND